MKKRIFALALALCMMLSVMPTSFAGNGFLTDDSKAAPQSGILTDDSKAVSQSGVLTGASKYYRQDGILYNTGSQSGAPYSLPSGTLNAPTGILTLDENVDSTTTLSGSGISAGTRSSALVTDDENGLELSKKVTEKDGTYTITLEAYTTGEVTTSTKTIPVDIVLVLDQSGSMAYNFNGNSTNNNSERRQYAMKQTINNFISSVSEKYSEDADHRISIVTFSSEAETLQGWTYVNEVGKTMLQGKISGLPDSPGGATNISDGMKLAENLMGEGYNYTGTNTQRQKVVVAFTDGVPTTSRNFDVGVANDAISSANALKNSGVTIYSVGIFKGADPNKIHGDYYYRAVIADTPCDGSVNSYWGTTNLSSSNANDFADPDVPAGNRFLNYISNNYTAKDIGLSFDNKDGVLGGYKWIITANYSGTNAGYYLTADNASSLNNIFQTISQTIQTPSVDLGSKTEVRDAVSPYFDLPANASKIKLYTAAAKADGTFEDRKQAPSEVEATISSDHKTVSVTGFDFNKNFVSENAKEDGTYGKKLIIEFPIEPKTGFLGGNGVPTNDDANAGIYLADKLIENFPNTSASTNVPIADVNVDVTDKNIYLSQTLDDSGLLADTTVTVGSVELNMTNTTTYGLEAWQYAYVTISTNVATNTGAKWTDDEVPFTLTCTVKTKDGTDVMSGYDTANVNVFKPVVTFQDSTIYLGTSPAYEDNYKGVVWKHGKTDADSTEMGTAPELAYSYDPLQSNVPTDCVDVNVNVAIDQNDVTDYVTFTDTREDEYEFTVHVVRPTITFDDIEIYLSQTPTYTDESSFAWDDKCQCNLTERSAVAGEEPTFSYDYDPNADAFTECTEVNVTVKLGDVDYTNAVTLKNGDGTVRGTETAEFKVHVFLPRITLESQPLWADYDCDVALNKGIKSITITNWADQCGTKAEKQHTDALPQCSDPRYQFQRNGENITSYNAKNAQVTDYSTINVALDSVKIGATQYDMSVLPEVKPVEYKIHVNKFDLTINKTWNGADVYKQDAIFTVSGGRGTFQVVLPAGQDSIVIKGLLCGQAYTVTEDSNWTWRWNSSSEKPVLEKTDTAHTSVSVRNPHDQTDDGTNPGAHGAKSVSFTNTLKETLGELWFSFCTFVKNIFGAGRLEGRGN